MAAAAALIACDGGETAPPPEAAAAGAAVTAPAKPAAAPAASFAYSAGEVFGYYSPVDEVAVGPLKLDHLHLATPDEFVAWGAGTRSDTYAPTMLVFDDTSSPMVATELGETREVSERVLPASYAVSDERVRFTGSHPRLGEVAFDGALDAAKVRAATAAVSSGIPPQGPVLRGRLSVGDRVWEDVAFTWSGGD